MGQKQSVPEGAVPVTIFKTAQDTIRFIDNAWLFYTDPNYVITDSLISELKYYIEVVYPGRKNLTKGMRLDTEIDGVVLSKNVTFKTMINEHPAFKLYIILCGYLFFYLPSLITGHIPRFKHEIWNNIIMFDPRTSFNYYITWSDFKVVSDFIDGDQVLEVGAGTGANGLFLREQFGIDIIMTDPFVKNNKWGLKINPEIVLEYTADDAIEKYDPEVLMSIWPSPEGDGPCFLDDALKKFNGSKFIMVSTSTSGISGCASTFGVLKKEGFRTFKKYDLTDFKMGSTAPCLRLYIR